MRKRLILLAGGMLLVVLVVLVVRSRLESPAAHPPNAGVHPDSSFGGLGTSSAPGLAQTQEQLLKDITKQGNTPERAKLLFSMAVGPLPGVTVPVAGRDPADFDGTLAVGYLYQVWNSLTAAQRAAAAQLI